MVRPIQSLANMEYALYGGMNTNTLAPSLMNGYKADLSSLYQDPYSQYMYPYYGNYYPTYTNTQQNKQNIGNSTIQNNTTQTVTDNQTKKDINTLADYYKDTNFVEEGFGGALLGTIPFTLMENPQTFRHPFNAHNAMRRTDGFFNSIRGLENLWKNEAKTMQGAYSQLYRVNRNALSKWPVLSKWFVGTMPEADRKYLSDLMKRALESKDPNKIRIATEQLRAASSMNGRIPRAFKWIKGKITGGATHLKSPAELAKEALASGSAQKAAAETGKSFWKSFTPKSILGGAGMFALFEAVMDWSKIKAAFGKDNSSGMQQLGQTAVKAAGCSIGFTAGQAAGKAVGRLAGAWAAAKVGALVGSAVPGLGTAIGAIAGFAGASLGMWLSTKISKAVVGEDVGQKIEIENMKKTKEGQQNLLSYTIGQYQNGEKVPPEVLSAAQRLYA